LIALVVFPIAGLALIAFGVSGLHNSQELGTRGVPVLARVSATDGYGSTGVQFAYRTTTGRQVRGTVSGVNRSAFHLGEAVAVVYDAEAPGVVALPGDPGNRNGAATELAVGLVFIAVAVFTVVAGLASVRRSRRRAVRAVLGD